MSPRPSALLSRRLPPYNGWSLSLRHCLPTRDVRLTRHQQGFIVIHPSSLPLACGPGRSRDPRALPLGFAPRRPEPAAHARAGTGLDTDPGYVLDITSNLLQRSHSPRATSRRKRNVLPSTATARRRRSWRPRSASQAPIAAASASGSSRARVRRIVVSPGATRCPVSGSRRAPSAASTWLGHVRGPLGDRGHRPGTGQDGSRSDDEDGDQRVAAPGARPRVSDGGQVGEEVRCFGRSQLIGVRELGQAKRDRG